MPMSRTLIGRAEVLNARRFLSLDLNYGRRVDRRCTEFLMDNGMTRDEYHFFINQHLRQHCIMGNDYYVTNEHHVAADGSTCPSGEVFGYAEITRSTTSATSCRSCTPRRTSLKVRTATRP